MLPRVGFPRLRRAILVLAMTLFAGLTLGDVAGAAGEPDVQWQAQITVTASNTQVRGPGWESQMQLLQSGTAARVQAHGAQISIIPWTTADGDQTYDYTSSGSGGLAQFKQVLFDDLEPVGGLLGGPAALTLTGDVQAGEELAVNLESNPSTGYSWQVTQIEPAVLQSQTEVQFTPQSNLLGAPAQQTVRLKGMSSGRATLVLHYRRPWASEAQATRVISIQGARLAQLLDLTHTNSAKVRPAANGHRAPALTAVATLPSAFSWKDQGKLTPIRDQGNCGSCWAFSTVGAFESAKFIKDSASTDMSEQYLVSCNTNGWSCNGGWFAHDYHIGALGKNQTQAGAVVESDLPYTASNGSCTSAFNHPYAFNNWYYVTSDWSIPPVDAIKNAIYTFGPVSAGVCASGPVFGSYRSGIYSTEEKSYCGGSIDHAIMLVGWDDATQTWLLRNSWGTGWGEQGYMRIKWGISNVGYGANYIVYNPTFPSCYTLTTSVSPSGSGTVNTSPAPNCNNGTQYTAGTQVTLTATANDGYAFSSWSGGASASVNPTTVTMTGAKSVTANLTANPVCYTLTTSVSPSGSGTVNASPAPNCNNGTQYTAGTQVTLTATANNGYAFSSWSGGASGSVNPTTSTMDGAKTVTGNYSVHNSTDVARVEIDHTYVGDLIVKLGVGNPASPACEIMVSNQEGADTQNIYKDVDLASCQAFLPPTQSRPWYLWTHDYFPNDQGQITTFRITSNGQMFTAADTPVPITDGNTSISYIYGSAPVCYTLTTGASPSGGGTVNTSPAPNCNNGTQYTAGTQVTLTATANSGYAFSSWSGGAGGSVNPTTVTMDGAKTVTANMTSLNLLANPDFELDANANGKPDTWTANAYFTRSSAAYQSGSYAGRFYATNNASFLINQPVRNLVAGKTYNFAGWVNIPPTTDAFTFKLQIQWRTASNALVRTDTLATFTSATGGWVQRTASKVAPARATTAQVVLAVTSLRGTVYVDNLSFGP